MELVLGAGGELLPGPYVDCPEEGCAYTLEDGTLLRYRRDRDLVFRERPLLVDPELDAVEHERPRLRRIARMLAEADAITRLASPFVVFVPRKGDLAGAEIRTGSGIVGAPTPGSEHVVVHFDGAIYGDIAKVRLADRVFYAYSRLALDFPTRAFLKLPRASLVEVGVFDPPSGTISAIDSEAEAAIAAWIGSEDLDPAELVRSGVGF